ncbi:MAG: hypothetical protein QXM96_00205, partial [Candidatus Woesearchaeota archaeon]
MKSELSNINFLNEAFFKNELFTNKLFVYHNNFELSFTPVGHLVSNQGTGSISSFVNLTQFFGTIGCCELNITGVSLNSRSGIGYSVSTPSRNFLLRFDDSYWTLFETKVYFNSLSNNNYFQIGLSNTILPTNVGSGLPQTNFGNTIGFRYDPSNTTGENSGITNLFLFTKVNGVGFNSVNTGINLLTNTWYILRFIIENTSTGIYLKAFVNGNLILNIFNPTNMPFVVSPSPFAG